MGILCNAAHGWCCENEDILARGQSINMLELEVVDVLYSSITRIWIIGHRACYVMKFVEKA